MGTPLDAFQHLVGHHEDCVRRTRSALGDAGFDAAFRHGAGLGAEEVVAYVMNETLPALAPSAKAGDATLTRRERQVAELVAQGLSNKDIAAKLVVSQRTAESHVGRILVKLGFTSRTQIVTWLAQDATANSEGPPGAG